MKKWGILLLTLLCVATLCLSLVGCADTAKEESEEAPTTTTTTTEPEGMTEAKAIELACRHWGVRNGETVKDDQHVQRMINVSVVSYPTEDMPYYILLLSRQNSDNSWTSLETLKLDGETGEVIAE